MAAYRGPKVAGQANAGGQAESGDFRARPRRRITIGTHEAPLPTPADPRFRDAALAKARAGQLAAQLFRFSHLVAACVSSRLVAQFFLGVATSTSYVVTAFHLAAVGAVLYARLMGCGNQLTDACFEWPRLCVLSALPVYAFSTRSPASAQRKIGACTHQRLQDSLCGSTRASGAAQFSASSPEYKSSSTLGFFAYVRRHNALKVLN